MVVLPAKTDLMKTDRCRTAFCWWFAEAVAHCRSGVLKIHSLVFVWG
ncbi:hypothetical protein A2U01_0028250, partial [Trifolium medium]|nr:hypothetical protein [Trifolium medium]